MTAPSSPRWGESRRRRARLGALAGGALLAAAIAPPALGAARVSQGVYRMGAETLWAHRIRGEGQTVAILDRGFGGLDDSIAAGILPPRAQMTLQTFDKSFGFAGRDIIGARTDHGVRVAEVVHSVAPRAHLVLVNYHTLDEFVGAVAWIRARHIPIVNHSNSFLQPPYDGTSLAARVVDQAARAGVLWVNSAGNFAQRHWGDDWRDRDGDGREDFAGADVMPIAPDLGDTLLLVLSWPRGRGARYAMFAQRRDSDGVWRTRFRGEPSEDGRTLVSYRIREVGKWRLAIVRRTGPGTRLDLFSRTIGFGSLARGASSVPTPGDATGSLSVGATVWDSDRLADYSSRGPTAAGVRKPDLTGPTDVTVNPAFRGVAGTSTAAPHVAAAAALVRQRRQAQRLPVSPGALRAALTSAALDLGARGPDQDYGAGRVRLDTTPPAVRVQLEPHGPRAVETVRAGTRPVLRVTVIDEGRVQASRILEGSRLLATGSGKTFRWRAPSMAVGRHALTVQANDLAGNGGRASLTLVVRR
jgi:subtilase family protein